MKVVALKAENFKRLTAVSIRPDGTFCQITGRNGQGKSSVLDAIQAALGGAKWTPDEPIRKGADAAKVVLETEEFIVTRRWSEEHGDRITIESKDTGATFRSPQAMLDKLIGGVSFDPLAFTRMAPKAQAELLRKITGVDTTDLDGERKAAFDDRAAMNRQLAAAKAKLADAEKEEIETVPEPGPEQDISAFMAEIEQAAKVKSQIDFTRANLASAAKRIAELEKDLKAFREAETEHARKLAEMDEPDVTAIKARVDAAKAHNAQVRAAVARKAEADRKLSSLARLRKDVQETERIAAHHTSRLAEIDQEKAELLAAAKFPVPGLGLDGDTVTFQGVPFAQACTSQQIKIGLAIAASLNPGIRTVLVRDGSLLDAKSLEQVAVWAEGADMQVIIERVGEGPTGVVIEDGAVKVS